MSSSLLGKRIAWLIPGINSGAGGLQTIFRHASNLHNRGAVCDFHIIPGGQVQTEREATELLVNEYDCHGCRVYPLMQLDSSYDAVVATMWTTVRFMVNAAIPHKFYFVQDFEPWFYPMGDDFLEAEMTYSKDVIPITIGHWLAAKLEKECGTRAFVTDFCADSNIYRDLSTPREHALCVVFQPEKPRRCTRLVLDTLELLSVADPTLRLYAFGSNQTDSRLEQYATNLGILSKAECNELYNRCEIGLTMSTSNPSRIPFEMMAAGLPVVDVYRDNNLYDFDDDSIVLAYPSPDALASAVLEVLGDHSKQERMRVAGERFMSKRPIEKEAEQFLEHFERALDSSSNYSLVSIEKSYHLPPMKASSMLSMNYCELLRHQTDSQAYEHAARLKEYCLRISQPPEQHGRLYRIARKAKRALSTILKD